jgi:hypothetical protein
MFINPKISKKQPKRCIVNATLPAFGSGYAARFLVSFFKVKLGCVRKVGGQLTPSLGSLTEKKIFGKQY